MPYPEPPKTIVSDPIYGVHPHILDGSSGVIIDYGSFTVKQIGIEYTFDENDGINQYDSFYVYVWHMDVHTSGFAWIRFYYGDNDYDEFQHIGNSYRQFWLTNKNKWSNLRGIGDSTHLLERMGIYRQYIFRGIRTEGTSTWEFANLEPGLTKIVFMNNQIEWGGMKGIFILNHGNLVAPPLPEGGGGGGGGGDGGGGDGGGGEGGGGDGGGGEGGGGDGGGGDGGGGDGGGGGGGGGNGTPILENPYYLNEYVYRQNGGTVNQMNQIPAWSNAIQNTKTIVRNTAHSFDGSDFYTYFYDGYIRFPVNTRKYFGIASNDDSFMWIVEGDRLWSTVGHSHLYSAFTLAGLIEQTGDHNHVVFFIDDHDNHGHPGSFRDHRTDHFVFEANKLYTILIKITEHGLSQGGLFWGISDNSLQDVGQRIDNFPEYFGTGYTGIIINNPPILNLPRLEISFNDNDPPFDFDFSSRFIDPDGDNLIYSIEYSSIYFTATVQHPNIAKIHIIPINLQLTDTVYNETIALTARDTFDNVTSDTIIITIRGFNDLPIYTGADILSYSEDSQDVYLYLNTIFRDPEVRPLSFQVAQRDVGIINTQLSSDTLILKFLDNKNGDTQLSITATDVGNKSYTANIIVRVNALNDKPYAIPSQYPFAGHVLTDYGDVVHININEPEDFRREYVINLDTFIKDEEDASLDYNISIPSTNSQLFSGRIESTNLLKLEFVENQSGSGEIEVTATDTDTSNPLSLKVKFIVNIEGVDDPPYVKNKLYNIVRVEDAGSEEIDVSNVFVDIESNDLILSVIGNTNNSLVRATLQDKQLQLEYLKDQYGTCIITLNAEQLNNPNKYVRDSFTITVVPVDDDPYVKNPIQDKNRVEDPGSEEIDVSNVFADIESNNLSLSVIGNSNLSLVIATLQGNKLQLEYLEHQHGTCTIRLKAEQVNNSNKYVTHSFTITVTALDDAPYVKNKLDNIVRVEDAGLEEIDVSNVFADIESNDLILSVIGNTNNSLVRTTLQDNQLQLEYLEDQYGTCIITLNAEQLNNPNKYVRHSFTITVVPLDDDPYVKNPIQDKNRVEDPGSEEIDVSNVFADIESNDLILSVIGNTNNSLVKATLQDNQLQLEYLKDQHGTCTITLKAEQVNNSNKYVTHSFTITVFPFDDYPYVANAIQDKNRDEDAGSEEIDVSNVFADIESNDLILSVIGNTNNSLVTATLQDNKLQLEYLKDQHGTCTIILKAEQVNNPNKYVTHSFDIIVNSVPDAPVTVDNSPSETINVDEDSQNRTVSVSNKFFDPDGEKLELSINNTNPVVSSATLDKDSGIVTITFKSNANTTQDGEAKVIVKATDESGKSATYTINLIVNPINDRPDIILNIQDLEVNEDENIPPINLDDFFGDYDQDKLYYIVDTDNYDLVVPSLNDNKLTLQLVKNKHGHANITVNTGDRLLNEQGNTERLYIIQNFRITVNPVNDAAKSFEYYLYSHLSFPIYAGQRIMEFRNIEDDDDEIEEHRQYSFAIMENELQGYLSIRCMISGNYLIVKPGEIINNLPLNNILYIEIRDGDLIIPYHGPDNPIIIHRYDFAKIPSATGAPLSLIPKNLIL